MSFPSCWCLRYYIDWFPLKYYLDELSTVINPRHTCTARVMVVAVSVCLSVCLSMCPLSHISPLELLFVVRMPATYSAGNEGQSICGIFSENVLLQRLSTPSLDGHTSGRPFFVQRTCMGIMDKQVLDKTVHNVKLLKQLPYALLVF